MWRERQHNHSHADGYTQAIISTTNCGVARTTRAGLSSTSTRQGGWLSSTNSPTRCGKDPQIRPCAALLHCRRSGRESCPLGVVRHAHGKTLSVDIAGCCGWVDTAHPLAPSGHCHGAFSRRQDCPFADTPSTSLLKYLLKGQGGCSRMTVSPTARCIRNARVRLDHLRTVVSSAQQLSSFECATAVVL